MLENDPAAASAAASNVPGVESSQIHRQARVLCVRCMSVKIWCRRFYSDSRDGFDTQMTAIQLRLTPSPQLMQCAHQSHHQFLRCPGKTSCERCSWCAGWTVQFSFQCEHKQRKLPQTPSYNFTLQFIRSTMGLCSIINRIIITAAPTSHAFPKDQLDFTPE